MSIVAILLTAALLFSPASPKKVFTFSGTVGHGNKFSKTLPNGFIFDLSPSDCGWVINIHPLGEDDEEYVWPENVPIHNKNALFLDDEYDGDWEFPLKHPHIIFFAKSPQQAAKQREWIGAFDRGDYEKAKRLDSPESAFGKVIFKVIEYRKQKVEEKAFESPKDSYCADDLSFRVSVSNF